MLVNSLDLQDTPVEGDASDASNACNASTASTACCASCGSPLCKREEIVEYPEYLPFSISRTFFSKNYTMVKDCSHVEVNPLIEVQNVRLAGGSDE